MNTLSIHVIYLWMQQLPDQQQQSPVEYGKTEGLQCFLSVKPSSDTITTATEADHVCARARDVAQNNFCSLDERCSSSTKEEPWTCIKPVITEPDAALLRIGVQDETYLLFVGHPHILWHACTYLITRRCLMLGYTFLLLLPLFSLLTFKVLVAGWGWLWLKCG